MSKNLMNLLDVQCPYCGYEWLYSGSQKHYATCPNPKCQKKVRLHPYARKGYRPLSDLKFPNENYQWLEVKK
jgi:hypothetical protein